MTARVEHIDAVTWHGRKGDVDNAFRYTIDYVLFDAEAEVEGPWLFARNRPAPMSVRDSDHGGPPKSGRGAPWVRGVLREHGIRSDGWRIELLTQPRVLGHVFNPVSFWLVRDRSAGLRVVIAEVTNTFGDRHSYLCHHDDLSVIEPTDILRARKIFHVSPFQPVDGDYAFRFEAGEERIAIRIDLTVGNGGVVATLTGKRRPLDNKTILRAMLRRPFGSRRVLGLIHWQALKLWWKGAPYRVRPLPPSHDVSR